MKELTKEKAIEIFDSRKWEAMSYLEKAYFQINEPRLCMPFDVFHEAVERVLGRPVFTHSFGIKESVELMKKQIANEVAEYEEKEGVSIWKKLKNLIK